MWTGSDGLWLHLLLAEAFYAALVLAWSLRAFESGPQAEDDFYEAPGRSEFVVERRHLWVVGEAVETELLNPR